MKRFSKICAGVLTAGALASAVAFGGCGDSANADTMTNAEVMGFAGATTVALSSNLATGVDAGSASTQANALAVDSDDQIASIKTAIENAIADSLDQYMAMFDGIAGGKDAVDVEVAENSDVGYEKYAYKMTISSEITSANANFYYTETANDKTKVDDINKNVSSSIEGLISCEEVKLYVAGNKAVEQNKTEITLKMFAEESGMDVQDEATYIEFVQSYEDNDGKEQEEFAYKIVVAGTEIDSFNFEISYDKSGYIEMCVEHGIEEFDVSTLEYEIKKENDTISIDLNVLTYEINITAQKSTATRSDGKTLEEGQYYYVYTITTQLFTDTFVGNTIQG